MVRTFPLGEHRNQLLFESKIESSQSRNSERRSKLEITNQTTRTVRCPNTEHLLYGKRTLPLFHKLEEDHSLLLITASFSKIIVK